MAILDMLRKELAFLEIPALLVVVEDGERNLNISCILMNYDRDCSIGFLIFIILFVKILFIFLLLKSHHIKKGREC